MRNSQYAVANVEAYQQLEAAIGNANYGDDIQSADVNLECMIDALEVGRRVVDPVVPLQHLLAVGTTLRDVRQAFLEADFVRLTRVLAESCSSPTLSPLLETYAKRELHAFITDLESRRVSLASNAPVCCVCMC